MYNRKRQRKQATSQAAAWTISLPMPVLSLPGPATMGWNHCTSQKPPKLLSSANHISGNDPATLAKDLTDSFNINVVGNINLFNLFLPLIRIGSAKKVIAISTGMADLDLIAKYDVHMGGPYSISKAALNAAVAKYSAQSRKEGILFMAISPGLVETGHNANGAYYPF
jgi:NAD(P)-dependent dehydrogenase (short-subunit alcohol dehydrogenase family)